MNTLFTAIYTKYLASGLPAAGMTGLYNTEAPAGSAFPYGVFTMPDNSPDWTFTENFENCLIQFNLYSDNKTSPVNICSLFELLKTAFDFVDLDITGYGSVSLVREIATLGRIDNVWDYMVRYRFLIEKD